jgi:hypothetical protein
MHRYHATGRDRGGGRPLRPHGASDHRTLPRRHPTRQRIAIPLTTDHASVRACAAHHRPLVGGSMTGQLQSSSFHYGFGPLDPAHPSALFSTVAPAPRSQSAMHPPPRNSRPHRWSRTGIQLPIRVACHRSAVRVVLSGEERIARIKDRVMPPHACYYGSLFFLFLTGAPAWGAVPGPA